jgi:hypothetical protein
MTDNVDNTIDKAEEILNSSEDSTTTNISKSQAQSDEDMVAKLVQSRIESELKPIKGKLDNAFKQRDEALAKIAEFERKEREATLKQLEAEGKHKEIYELKLAEERAKNEALSKRNTELSRDVAVRDALKNLVFRNDKAADMAFKDIVANLVQNEAGQWVHRSGISVRDYCDAFSKDDEQSFLFKAKSNSGAGTSTTNTNVPADTGKSKSLFSKSQAEVLKMAAEGKLGVLQTY